MHSAICRYLSGLSSQLKAGLVITWDEGLLKFLLMMLKIDSHLIQGAILWSRDILAPPPKFAFFSLRVCL